MPTPTIRRAERADAETLLNLVRELAAYEHEPNAVKATVADLERDGWGETPRFEALLAEVDGRVAGFALLFPNYSTWEGRAGLYLEDLFVSEWARRHGVGRKLFEAVAKLAVERNGALVDLNVLTWNPARAFYERIGVRHLSNWTPYRLTGEALRQLAEGD
jgi:GNAT superfamily N-acetyltransferase